MLESTKSFTSITSVYDFISKLDAGDNNKGTTKVYVERPAQAIIELNTIKARFEDMSTIEIYDKKEDLLRRSRSMSDMISRVSRHSEKFQFFQMYANFDQFSVAFHDKYHVHLQWESLQDEKHLTTFKGTQHKDETPTLHVDVSNENSETIARIYCYHAGDKVSNRGEISYEYKSGQGDSIELEFLFQASIARLKIEPDINTTGDVPKNTFITLLHK